MVLCKACPAYLDLLEGAARQGGITNGSKKTTLKTGLKTSLKTSLKTGLKTSLKKRDEIIEILRSHPSITVQELMSKTGLSRNGIKWNLNQLKAAGSIQRVGPDKGGHWEVLNP